MGAPSRNGLLRLRRGPGLDAAVVGTGFVARAATGATYGITCAHVVNATLGRHELANDAPFGAEIWADLPFYNSRVVKGSVVAWRPPVSEETLRSGPAHDIAVFSLEGEFPRLPIPQLRMEPPDRVAPEGTMIAFDGYGFMRAVEGLPVRGYLRGIDAGGWLVAQAENDIGRFIEEGMSGSPLIGNGAVLGMAARRFEIGTRQALAVPAISFATAFPPLARPYVGLNSFRGETAHLYFGRDARTAELDQLLRAEGRIAVIGASGSGKSSLALAGLAPLRRSEGWRVVSFRPGKPSVRPLANLAEALLREAGMPAGPDRSKGAIELADEIANEPSTLAGRFASICEATNAVGIILIIDQFEEFLLPGALTDERLSRERVVLLAEMLRLCRPSPGEQPVIACVLTVRADLLGPVSGLEDVRPFFQRPLWLRAMDEAELAEVVEGPARAFDVKVDSELVGNLVKQMGREPGRLALLEVTLESLWPTVHQESMGGPWRLRMPKNGVCHIEAAIAERAEQVITELPEHLAPALEGAMRKLVRVVDGRPARRVAQRSDFKEAEWAVLTGLAEARLVSLSIGDGSSEYPGNATAELVHEALIERWERLRAAVRDDGPFLRFRDGLDADVRRWEEEEHTSERLLRGKGLAEADRWLAERRDDLTPRQLAFIKACGEEAAANREAELQEAKRSVQWTRRMLQLVGAGGTLALVFAALAWGMAIEARDQRFEALRSVSAVLIDQATEALRSGDNERAYLIAAQAAWWPNTPSESQRPRLAEADAALLLTARNLLAARLPAGQGSDITPDGKHIWIYQRTPDNTFELLDYKIDDKWNVAQEKRVSLAQPIFPIKRTIFDLISKDGEFALVRGLSSVKNNSVFGVPLILNLRTGKDASLVWPYGCDTIVQAETRCDTSFSGVKLIEINKQAGDAVFADTKNRLGLLKLSPEPHFVRLPIPYSDAETRIALSPDGNRIVSSSPNGIYILQLPFGNSEIKAPSTVTDARDIVFLGNNTIVAARGEKLLVSSVSNPNDWQEVPVEGLGFMSLNPTDDGIYLGVGEGQGEGWPDSPLLFNSMGDRIRPIALAPYTSVEFYNGSQIIGLRSGARLSLHEYDPSKEAFFHYEFGPDDPDRILFPSASETGIFFLSGARRVEAWRRLKGAMASRVGVVAELARQPDNPILSQDGSTILIRDGAQGDYRLYSTALLFAKREDAAGKELVSNAENALKRCLTPAEIVNLGILPPGRYPKDAMPTPTLGQHGCPNALSYASQPDGYWDFWRPFMRMLVSHLSIDETDLVDIDSSPY